MNTGQIPEPPVDSLPELLAWARMHLPEIVRYVNKLKAARIRLGAPVGQAPAGVQMVEGERSIEIVIPIQFAGTIPPITSGGTTDANCRATLTALLTALSRTGQNP